jgi:hypothetical protein
MMLDLNASTVEKDLSCLTRSGGLLRPSHDHCTVATDVRYYYYYIFTIFKKSKFNSFLICLHLFPRRINEAVISWVVESGGDYTIWLYELYNQTDKSVLGCVPFTFSLTLTPFDLSENQLNCKGTLFIIFYFLERN